tara:strand:- start:71 stop:523 length:453 start_codon:yes stop_codon:yes gene_type:complete
MSIRLLNPSETAALIPGAKEFFAEGNLQGSLNERHFCETISKYINSGVGFCLVDEESGVFRGSIAAAIFPDYATGDVTCMELYWFVPKEDRGLRGVRLLKSFEAEARNRGAKRIMMMHLTSGKYDKFVHFYEKCGYSLKEQVFAKELGNN